MTTITLLVALWTYPIIAYLIVRFTSRRRLLRKRIFLYTSIVVAICILGLATQISTTLSAVDWFLITSFYFIICLVLWWTQFQSNRTLKIAGFILSILVFTLGYLSSTIGILGIAFATVEQEPVREKWLDNGIIYKEYNIGMATSHYRGKKVEINKTIRWFPILEWNLSNKTYLNFIFPTDSLNVNYTLNKNELLLSAKNVIIKGNKVILWSDTLSLGNNLRNR